MRFASKATNPHPPKASNLAAMKALAAYPVEVSDNLRNLKRQPISGRLFR